MANKSAKTLPHKESQWESRKDSFLKEAKRLSELYKIDLVPTLRQTEQGIFPQISLVDMSEHYEQKVGKN